MYSYISESADWSNVTVKTAAFALEAERLPPASFANKSVRAHIYNYLSEAVRFLSHICC